ncbi:MAG: hypothetical protein H6742_07820 [Alphaproteobacteria bacterium]|nr:hypothetical protein [Alphaproteobacteria bacterium]
MPIRIAGGQRVQSIPRSLRGGQSVRFPGDVVVYGDVNPGAVVEAGGNILVFGALRGLAHAGSHGDEAAVIMAFDLRPTQLRIGGRIAFQGLEDDIPRGPGFRPEIAFVTDERIRIEPWRGRLPTEQVATGDAPPSTKTPGDAAEAAPVTEQ